MRNKTLTLSIASSITLILAIILQWHIYDILTPFLGGPLIALIWLGAILSALWSLVHAFLYRKTGISVIAPAAISALALLIACFVPFTELWLYTNFHLNQSAREQVVENIRSGIIAHDASVHSQLIALTEGASLTLGGGEVLVQETPEGPFVFFYTFRGILDNYSGFLWVPKGSTPQQFNDAGESGTTIIPYADRWYFIGHG